MPSRRPKKTATLTLRVDPEIKAAAEYAAADECRSLTSLIEMLLLTHCKGKKLYPIQSTSTETRNENK